MKKKLLILLAILCVVGGLLFTIAKKDAKTIPINQEWELSDEEISLISLESTKNSVDIEIVQTDNDTTTVSLSGNLTEDEVDQIEKITLTDNSLDINLSEDNSGFSLAVKEGETIKLTISLAKNATIKNLNIDSGMGDVYAKIPNNYQGGYELDAGVTGKIKACPNTDNSQSSMICISTAGDIEIVK